MRWKRRGQLEVEEQGAAGGVGAGGSWRYRSRWKLEVRIRGKLEVQE